MALPDFSMRQLLEAGAHFGHQTHRWNPKMGRYIYGVRNDIHIIDLAQTVPLLHQALQARQRHRGRGRPRAVRRHQAPGGRCRSRTRRKRSAQYYVNSRWLGGMLTNWKTISNSIKRLRKLEETAGRRRAGPHQEGAPDAAARARQARQGAGRHQGHGRHARPHVRDRHQQGAASRSRRPTVSAFRSWRSSTPIAIPTASPSRSRAMTMRGAPSRSIATSSRAPRSTASRASQGELGIDVGRGSRRRSTRRCREAAGGAGADVEGTPSEAFELLIGPRGAPDDLKHLHGLGPQMEKKPERRRHLPLLAGRRHDPRGHAKLDQDLKLGGPHRARAWVEQAESLCEA